MSESLYAQLCSWANLRLAHQKAARGKRGRAAAAAFEVRLADELLQLQTELTNQSYRPGPYRSFTIHDPKVRLISAAPFRDRVVHHSLCNLIEPIFERSFIAHSYANRLGKGTHRALDHAQALAAPAPRAGRANIKSARLLDAGRLEPSHFFAEPLPGLAGAFWIAFDWRRQ